MSNLNTRQQAILKKLTVKKKLPIRYIVNSYDVSRETVRKELIELESQGYIKRSRGVIFPSEKLENITVLKNLGLLSKDNRKQYILSLLTHENEFRTSVLTSRLKVSALTIRKDLIELENEGRIIRKHGSVALVEIKDKQILKKPNNIPLKIYNLGQHCLLHINDGETLFMDGSEVNKYLATLITAKLNLKIVTNNLEIVRILQKSNCNHTIQILSGIVKCNNNYIQIDSEQSLDNLNIDIAFIGPSSFANNTYYLNENEDFHTIMHITRVSRRIYLILDSVYLGKKGRTSISVKEFFPKIHEIIVDDSQCFKAHQSQFSHNDPLVVCGSGYSYRIGKKEEFKIGFLVDNSSIAFVSTVHNSIIEASSLHYNVSLMIRECNGKFQTIISNLEALIEEKPDLIIDYSRCVDSIYYTSERCRSHNIPLIMVDYHSIGSIFYGADNSKAGEIAGRYAWEYISNHWKKRLDHLVVLTKEEENDPFTYIRLSASLDYIEKFMKIPESNIHIVDATEPKEIVPLLKKIPNDEKMLCLTFNEYHFLTAYPYLEKYREKDNTIVVSQNYTNQIGELMKSPNSLVLGCVHYNQQSYGENIINLALQILNNKNVSQYNYTNLTWISRDVV